MAHRSLVRTSVGFQIEMPDKQLHIQHENFEDRPGFKK